MKLHLIVDNTAKLKADNEKLEEEKSELEGIREGKPNVCRQNH